MGLHMSYLALARKYRPQSFEDVIGQEPVVTTLANALKAGRVAHAYLLAGPRGVGKTTLARILSMAVNCPKRKEGKADPCGTCEPCERTAEGADLDVLELDGASHNGVEAIREICANVLTLPARSSFRVYIIDEVHMLSASAFNALLKTLEEPPPHVKFIFATTHPHKVLPTILSRCQRFDLKRIPPEAIAKRLADVCRKEKIAAEPEALREIALRAEGGMRDALTLLDQARASGDSAGVSADGVRKMLGLSGADEMETLLAAVLAGDAGRILSAVDAAWMAGRDLESMARQVLEAATARVGEAPPAGRARLVALGSRLLAVWPQLAAGRAGRTAFEWAFLEALEPVETPSAAAPPPVPARSPSVPAPVREAEAPRREAELPKKAPPPRAPAPAPAAGPDLARVTGLWGDFIERVKKESRSTAAFLAEARPAGIQGAVLEIEFPAECRFHKDAVDSPTHRPVLEKCLAEVFSAALRVKTLLAAGGKPAPPPAPAPAARPDDGLAGADPLLKRAADIFQGRVITQRKEVRE